MLIPNQIVHLKSNTVELLTTFLDEKPLDFFAVVQDEAQINDIYYSIVRNKVETENAFFVEYQKDKLGYLKTKGEKLSLGSKILAMVKKTGAGKIPEMTTDISFVGNFIIYKPLENKGLSLSRKLNAQNKETLQKNFLDQIMPQESLIIRSSAANTSIENIKLELINFRNKSQELLAHNLKPLTKMPSSSNQLELFVTENIENLEKITTNDVSSYNHIKNFCFHTFPEFNIELEFIGNKNRIFDLYEIKEAIETVFSHKVKLQPKGFISIIQTPALTAIDIDSESAKNNDDFLELWVKEAAYQIQLRNLSGKIIIDPPFLPSLKTLKRIADLIKTHLENDSVNSYVAGVSPLGNIEISRERIRPTTLEILGGSDSIYGNNYSNLPLKPMFETFFNE
ncbi:MAG: ribonuclease E/G [Alphaproteobacteria bacterium]